MYIVITNDRVMKGATIRLLNKKYNMQLQDEEFHVKGNDKVLLMEPGDLTFARDMKKMSLIPLNKLYKEDSSKKYLYFMIALQIVTFIRIGG